MSLRIASVGDIMLGENLHHFRRGVASRYFGNFEQLLSPEVAEVIDGCDLFFGNFECSLLPDTEWKSASLERAMYAAPESATDFFKAWKPGIILNVANNHFGQHGKAASDYTVEHLKKKGIRCIGRDRHPLEIHTDGRRLMAWGVTIVEDQYIDAGYFKSTLENLIEDIDWVEKRPGDYWVVSIHWGDEYLTQPSDLQEELATKLIKKGVDLILGHHPHVVQPSRIVAGIPVVFSHGNFVFDQDFSRITQFGLLVINDLSGGQDFFGVRISKFCPATIHPFRNRKELEEYCSKNRSRFNPLLMRVLMKLELLTHCLNVPLSVWGLFLSRFGFRVLRVFGLKKR